MAKEYITKNLAFAVLVVVIGLTAITSITNKTTALNIEELTIMPDNVTTNELMTCSWNVTGALGVNVTWLNGSQVYDKKTNTTTQGDLSVPENTVFRGEVWTCQLDAWNETITINSSVNKTIQNSGPSDPILYNSTGQDQGNHTILFEDTYYNFSVQSTDPENDDVDYIISSGSNPFDSFSYETGIIEWTPTASDVGNHTVGFLSKDNQTPAAFSNHELLVVFQVLEVNDPPYFSPALTDQTVYENNCSWNYTVQATDEETPSGPFNFTIISVEPATSTTLNITQISNTTASIEFDPCPAFEDAGVHNVTLSVSEANNHSVNSTSMFELTVISVNHAPNITTTNTTINTSQNLELLLYFNATDLDNDTITFKTTALNCTTTIQNPWNITYSSTQYNFDGNTSFAEAWINFTNPNNLSNNHVICSGWVRVTANDTKQAGYIDLFINVSNVNDPPIINENSSYEENTLNNYNIQNLTAYVGAPFGYRVNASDIDTLTYEGDSLTFSTNDSRIPINPSTGLISLTPNTSMIGNYSFVVFVNDSYNATTNKTGFLMVYNNSAPEFVQEPTNQQAWEDITFNYNINATDEEDCGSTPDCGNITFTISYYNTSPVQSIANITINNITGVLSVTAVQSEIGIYNITVKVTDSYGASVNKSFLLFINNTNDCPYLYPITIPEPVVVGHPVSYIVQASDQDLLLPNSTENLTFYDNTTLFNITKQSNTTALIGFTPNSSDIGNYSIRIWVNDSSNNAGCVEGGPYYRIINLTVYNRTEPPIIQELYVKILENNTVLLNWTDVSSLSYVSINITENLTLFFNHSGWNDEKAYNQLNFTWFFDSTNYSTNYSITKHFNFFSSGNHIMGLVVNDTRLEQDNITIYIHVSNINRAPMLNNSLYNLTGDYAVDPVFEDISYFTGSTNNPRFHDLDNETLTFSVYNNTCEGLATISINGSQLTVTGNALGSCTAVFKATDPYNASVLSNKVFINVTDILPTTTTTTTTGGGGSTRTETVPVPLPEEIEQPKPLELIAPGIVIIYENKTIEIPIYVKNTWGDKIYGISLWAKTNVTSVHTLIKEPHYAVLNVNETKKTYLIVSNYRLGQSFEISVMANVSDPEFEDKGLIVIASLEARSEAEESEILVTFARDLLSGNPECAELNELLEKAQDMISDKNYGNALKLIHGTIEGCRYLVSNKAKIQQPAHIINKYLDVIKKNIKNFFVIAIAFFISSLAIFIAFLLQRKMVKKIGKTVEKEK